MPKHEPFSDDEKLEADLLAEEFLGKPIDHGSTVKAIAALEKRIAWLQQRMTDAEARLGDQHPDQVSLHHVLEPLRKERATAETQLAAYRQQLEGRN